MECVHRFIEALGCGKCVIPGDVDALEGAWAEDLKGVGRDLAARSALARFCVTRTQLCNLPQSMACGQRQAYEKCREK